MRHRYSGKKLSRPKDQRRALLRTLAVSLISHKTIKSTLTKCKTLRPFIEKLVTIARESNDCLSKRRLLLSKLGNQKKATEELIRIANESYKDRPGGYVRLLKMGYRYGDCAPMGLIQFVGYESKINNNINKT